ncbi:MULTISPECIES: metal-dependent hydrolase [Halostella]|uniref:metal-dependent hydrolase n=1 Tax=Halostella TaxID=1843185 RepID=UPI0019647233|nr:MULTISPECIES: metal-dependent hydrolase [Halostella]
MLGALSPDVVKVRLLIPATSIEAMLGIPFDWLPLHTLGGTVLIVAIGAWLVGPEQRRVTLLLLALGAVSHHALDLLLITPSGYAYPVLWPLTGYHPPTGNLYLSSDRWPAAVAGCIALVLWAGTRD